MRTPAPPCSTASLGRSLSPWHTGSGMNDSHVQPNPPNPTGAGATPPQNQAATQAAAPPAAATVLSGGVTEENNHLADELESTRRTLKERELRVMELEDENFRIKKAVGPGPAPAPAPAAKKKAGIRWTFFHEDVLP